MDELKFVKIKHFSLWNTLLEIKFKLQTGRSNCKWQDKRFVSGICIVLKKVSSKKNFFKWGDMGVWRYLNRHFTEEYLWMANKQMRSCSTLLIFREMQMKTMMRYGHTRIRMAKQQQKRTASVGDCGASGTLIRCW